MSHWFARAPPHTTQRARARSKQINEQRFEQPHTRTSRPVFFNTCRAAAPHHANNHQRRTNASSHHQQQSTHYHSALWRPAGSTSATLHYTNTIAAILTHIYIGIAFHSATTTTSFSARGFIIIYIFHTQISCRRVQYYTHYTKWPLSCAMMRQCVCVCVKKSEDVQNQLRWEECVCVRVFVIWLCV